MRIRILSDLHEEFRGRLGPLALPRVEADVLVFAGDIANGEDAIEVMTRPEFDGVPKIWVPGNHEYYGAAIVPARARLAQAVARANAEPRAAARGTIHLLDDAAVTIGGVRFVGGTLWTDYDLHGEAGREAAFALARRFVTDYRLCELEPGEPFTPEGSIGLHRATRAFLERALAQPFDGPTVAITHHAPHPGSVAPRFAGNAANPAFVSDLSTLIERLPAGAVPLWIHGHTHDSFDYEVAGTRVVANPAGYRKRAPGSLEPGSLEPGQVAPGQAAPGQATPGQAVPGPQAREARRSRGEPSERAADAVAAHLERVVGADAAAPVVAGFVFENRRFDPALVVTV